MDHYTFRNLQRRYSKVEIKIEKTILKLNRLHAPEQLHDSKERASSRHNLTPAHMNSETLGAGTEPEPFQHR